MGFMQTFNTTILFCSVSVHYSLRTVASCELWQPSVHIYRIHGIIDESNIWRFTLKMQSSRFLISSLSTVWKEIHAYSLNGIHLIWQNLHDLPN